MALDVFCCTTPEERYYRDLLIHWYFFGRFVKDLWKFTCLLSWKSHILISIKILGSIINQVLCETEMYPQWIDLIRCWLIFCITEGSGFTEWSANNSSLQTRTWPASGVCLRGKLDQLITACVKYDLHFWDWVNFHLWFPLFYRALLLLLEQLWNGWETILISSTRLQR